MRSKVLNLVRASCDAQCSLVAQDGGDVFPVRTFPCQIGRYPGIPIRINHPTVSLYHAELREESDRLVLVDLGSRNGTFVNGNRVTDQVHPITSGDLAQFGGAVFRLQSHHLPDDLSATCLGEGIGDLALALAQFEKLIGETSVVPVYQPIVVAGSGQLMAYEALARSRLFGLDKPELMFKAAEYFHMEAELSRLLRRIELIRSSPQEQPHLFLNTHPTELADFKRLILSLREIRSVRPKQPITLEVHEAAAADLNTMKMLRLALDDLNMTLAYDDFGAGQARLAELVEARPEYVKFDRQLVTGIDKPGSSRQQMVETLVGMCRQLGIITLAEGVETAGEARVCQDLGFELMQGFYYGRPAGVPASCKTLSTDGESVALESTIGPALSAPRDSNRL